MTPKPGKKPQVNFLKKLTKRQISKAKKGVKEKAVNVKKTHLSTPTGKATRTF